MIMHIEAERVQTELDGRTTLDERDLGMSQVQDCGEGPWIRIGSGKKAWRIRLSLSVRWSNANIA